MTRRNERVAGRPTQWQQICWTSAGGVYVWGGVVAVMGDSHWEGGREEGGREEEEAVIYSLNLPTRSSCLLA